jgi:hypothetical protein
MGQFSWFTQDTHKRIMNEKPMRVVMTDNKGRQYIENCYQGYGVFGGKDFYELLSEMNGYGSDRDKGLDLAFDNEDGEKIIYPSITESGAYMGGISPEEDPDQGFPD